MAISLFGKPVSELNIEDEAAKDGVPLICGITLEPEDSSSCLGLLKGNPPEALEALKTSEAAQNGSSKPGKNDQG